MPMRPPVFRAGPARTESPDAYRNRDPDRLFLQSRVWREKIRPRQLFREPMCRFCRALGVTKIAEQVDHIQRPFGDRRLQRDPGNFQSLCFDHHLAKSHWERGDTSRPFVIGTTTDGWPVIAAGGTIEIPEDARRTTDDAGFSS